MNTDKSKRAAIYLRVSTDGQTTDNQRLELEKIAEKSGWEITGIYEDKAISGAKGGDKRPEFDRLYKDATQRKFDIVMAWSVDRLGRSLQDLINLFCELKSLNVDLYLYQQGLDTTTPNGKAMFGMLSVFADFERDMIRERVNAGLERAKAEGKKLGRPEKDRDYELEKAVIADIHAGMSQRKAAEKHNIGRGEIYRIAKRCEDELVEDSDT